MKPILLPLSEVQKLGRKPANEMITLYKVHHKRAPTETTTLRNWLDAFPSIGDWVHLTGHLGNAGRILALEVVVRSARRVTPPDVDATIMAPITAAQAVLDVLWGEREMKAAASRVWNAHAAVVRGLSACEEDYQYAHAAKDVASVAVYASNSGPFQGGCIAMLVVDELIGLADDSGDERQAQKADFMAVLDRLEAGG